MEKKKLSDEKAENIRRKYGEGVTADNLSRDFGVCPSTIYRVLRNELYPSQDKEQVRKMSLASQVDQMLRLRKAGLNNDELSTVMTKRNRRKNKYAESSIRWAIMQRLCQREKDEQMPKGKGQQMPKGFFHEK